MEQQNIYVNSTGGRMAGQDIVLFMSLSPTPMPLMNAEQAQTLIYTSPVTAKILLSQLSSAINTYERLYGEIKLEADAENLKQVQTEVQDALKVTAYR